MNQEDFFKKITAHAKEYGFIFPSSEIYDGLSAVYDYGQNGVELKKNIREYWWKAMVQMHENIVGIDAAIFMHPTTWKASGHVDAFNDPLIDNRDSKKRYRADVLVEDYMAKIEEKINKEVEKARKRFGDAFNEEQFVTTNPRVLEHKAKIEEISHRLYGAMEKNDLDAIKQLILDLEIVCPISGTRNWTDVRQFNLMFATKMGSVADGSDTIYLRPETAQGIFVNYLNVQKTGRMKIPFGIAQTGKAFRNEIVARQFIFRMREFEQMEMQFFVRPGTELEWFQHWKQERLNWHLSLGLPAEKYRFHDHEKLAHYANAATDIEFDFPFGFKELEGIHSRTDFDLSAHAKYSGKKLQLPAILAPYKVAVLPLVKKDGLPEKAREIIDSLKADFMCQYEEKDSIGKRYRRQDAIGTPMCVTVDNDTLVDNTVTVRDRDTMQQVRVPIENLRNMIFDELKPKK